MSSRPALVVLTERFGATYRINFADVLGTDAAPASAPSLSGLSADELAQLGEGAALQRIEQALRRNAQTVGVISRATGLPAEWMRQACARLGKPLLLHLDDWLLGVPASLGNDYAQSYGPAYRASLMRCLTDCDGVVCSTPYLAQRVRQAVPGVRVDAVMGVVYQPFPGSAWALRARAARLRRCWRQRGRFVLGFAGSSSHVRDLELVVPALLAFMAQDASVRFECFGLPVPEQLQRAFPQRVQALGYTRDYGHYLQTLYELGWSLGICPLIDDDFNRSKTATKLLEYTGCGIPALCSRVEPYLEPLRDLPHPGAPIGDGEWLQALTAMRTAPIQRKRLQQELHRQFQQSAGVGPAATAWARVAMQALRGRHGS